MYSYIKGQVAEKNSGVLVVEAGGIGYGIIASADCFESVETGGDAKIYTYLNVKEDSHTLFGFAGADEKALFLRLIGVSGVGPKSALQVLALGYKTAAAAINDDNSAVLASAKGVSKKTADKIILELKGKIAAAFENSEVSDAVAALVNLGIPRAAAFEKVKLVNTAGLDAEAIIRAVLKK